MYVPANERWRYTVTPSLIGWVHTQNDPWNTDSDIHFIRSDFRFNGTANGNDGITVKRVNHKSLSSSVHIGLKIYLRDSQILLILAHIQYSGHSSGDQRAPSSVPRVTLRSKNCFMRTSWNGKDFPFRISSTLWGDNWSDQEGRW